MNPYCLLLIAIFAEIIGTSALKASHGFSKLAPSLLVLCGYTCSFWLMSITLKTLPVGIVYAIWSGLGILGIAIIGSVYFHETFGVWHLLGTTLIIAGVIILSVVTK